MTSDEASACRREFGSCRDLVGLVVLWIKDICYSNRVSAKYLESISICTFVLAKHDSD